ncbi:MAG: hypothetical protein ACRDD8_09355, partial [Bacteroidales bacterium]
MEKINVDSFIEDYAIAKGIKAEDLDRFFKPTMDQFENPALYDNITKGAELIEKHVSENNKFCLIGHVDMDS